MGSTKTTAEARSGYAGALTFDSRTYMLTPEVAPVFDSGDVAEGIGF